VAVAFATAATLLTLVVPVQAGAATSTPTLTVNLTRGHDVKVSWVFSTDMPRRELVLQVQRKAGTGDFVPFKTVARPRSKSSVVDQQLGERGHTYRARVVVNGDPGPWGNTASIGGPSPSTAPTTVSASTSTTTTQPDGARPPLADGQRECHSGYVDEVLRLANVERAKVGQFPLENDVRLARAARRRSIDQGVAETMSHTGWIATIREYGYTGGWLGENVAYGYGTPASVVSAWMASSGHRANLLAAFEDSGVGCVISKNGRVFWTHDFGA
jgi:uncharacterized protein YkwD